MDEQHNLVIKELPETQISIEDDKKTIIEWYYNDKNQKVKKTTISKLNKTQIRVKKEINDRKNAKPFGRALNEGNKGGITRMDNSISIRITAKVKEQKAKSSFEEAWKTKIQASQNKWVSSRQTDDNFWDEARNKFNKDNLSNQINIESPVTSGAYKAPARREGASAKLMSGDKFGSGSDLAKLKIGNLSKEVEENDLQVLCANFGSVQRVHVVKDKYTNESRGVGFVNFYRRADAEKAFEQLNGYGYDNLILNVEWSEDSPEYKAKLIAK